MKYFAYSQIALARVRLQLYIDIDAKTRRYATHLYQYGLSLPEKTTILTSQGNFVNIHKAYVAPHRKDVYSCRSLLILKPALSLSLPAKQLLPLSIGMWLKTATARPPEIYIK